MLRPMTDKSPLKPVPSEPFVALENKSYEPHVTEAKTADVDPFEEPVEPTVQVTMVHHVTLGDRDLVPGVAYDLPSRVAGGLVDASRATYTTE